MVRSSAGLKHSHTAILLATAALCAAGITSLVHAADDTSDAQAVYGNMAIQQSASADQAAAKAQSSSHAANNQAPATTETNTQTATPAPGTPTSSPSTPAPARSAVRISRDARIDYGEFKISRMRIGEMRSRDLQSTNEATTTSANIAVSPATATASTDTYPAISVPLNTIPILDPSGSNETLQQRSERIATERKLADAEAREADARAEAARLDAQNSADRGYYGPVIYGGYAGSRNWYRSPARWQKLDRPSHGFDRTHEPTVTTERFVSDQAQWSFADAATPQISATTDRLQQSQLKFSRDAYPGELVRIQNRVDDHVRGNKLQRVKVSKPLK